MEDVKKAETLTATVFRGEGATLSRSIQAFAGLGSESKVAFTLAEFLIVLGVIGVVAALTIPNLIVKYQKRETANRLKIVYSQIKEAIKLSEVENDDITGWDFSRADLFDYYIQPYMKIVQVESYDKLFDEGIIYKWLNGGRAYTATSSWWIGRAPVKIYTTINGTQIFMNTIPPHATVYSSSPNASREVHIDINGYKTGPNKMGRDWFMFQLNHDLGFWPQGIYSDDSNKFKVVPNMDRDSLIGKNMDNIDTVNGTPYCKAKKTGNWCAALIMIDGWEIKADYPW